MVQDRKSAVIYGMPTAALNMDAVDRVEKIENIARKLVSIINTSNAGLANARSGHPPVMSLGGEQK